MLLGCWSWENRVHDLSWGWCNSWDHFVHTTWRRRLSSRFASVTAFGKTSSWKLDIKVNNFQGDKIRDVLEVYQHDIRGELDMDSGKALWGLWDEIRCCPGCTRHWQVQNQKVTSPESLRVLCQGQHLSQQLLTFLLLLHTSITSSILPTGSLDYLSVSACWLCVTEASRSAPELSFTPFRFSKPSSFSWKILMLSVSH